MENIKIPLSLKQQEDFQTVLKIGILKELHGEKMLTDTQLTYLLSDIKQQHYIS